MRLESVSESFFIFDAQVGGVEAFPSARACVESVRDFAVQPIIKVGMAAINRAIEMCAKMRAKMRVSEATQNLCKFEKLKADPPL
jgi:hypothetical protein